MGTQLSKEVKDCAALKWLSDTLKCAMRAATQLWHCLYCRQIMQCKNNRIGTLRMRCGVL
jgi:hypothetical protein